MARDFRPAVMDMNRDFRTIDGLTNLNRRDVKRLTNGKMPGQPVTSGGLTPYTPGADGAGTGMNGGSDMGGGYNAGLTGGGVSGGGYNPTAGGGLASFNDPNAWGGNMTQIGSSSLSGGPSGTPPGTYGSWSGNSGGPGYGQNYGNGAPGLDPNYDMGPSYGGFGGGTFQTGGTMEERSLEMQAGQGAPQNMGAVGPSLQGGGSRELGKAASGNGFTDVNYNPDFGGTYNQAMNGSRAGYSNGALGLGGLLGYAMSPASIGTVPGVGRPSAPQSLLGEDPLAGLDLYGAPPVLNGGPLSGPKGVKTQSIAPPAPGLPGAPAAKPAGLPGAPAAKPRDVIGRPAAEMAKRGAPTTTAPAEGTVGAGGGFAPGTDPYNYGGNGSIGGGFANAGYNHNSYGVNPVTAMNDQMAAAREGYSYSGMNGYGGGGPAGGGKIVCTAMNRQYGFGSFRNAVWLAYSARHLTPAHEVGYHAIFLPLLTASEGHVSGWRGVLWRTLQHIARERTADLRAEMKGGRRRPLGMAYRAVLEPLCWAVGKIKGA